LKRSLYQTNEVLQILYSVKLRSSYEHVKQDVCKLSAPFDVVVVAFVDAEKVLDEQLALLNVCVDNISVSIFKVLAHGRT